MTRLFKVRLLLAAFAAFTPAIQAVELPPLPPGAFTVVIPDSQGSIKCAGGVPFGLTVGNHDMNSPTNLCLPFVPCLP